MKKKYKSSGTEIKAVRVSLGLTQAKLAKLFNKTSPKTVTTTRSDISRYELDLSDLPTTKYKKFLSLLDD